MSRYTKLFAVFLVAVSFSSHALAAPSDFKVRCFTETKDDTGLVTGYTAETCEDIGDSVPYFSLGRLISPEAIYDASADLKCQNKSKQNCLTCLSKWRTRYIEMLELMYKNKLISNQNRGWMKDALQGFYNELKSGC